MLESLKDELKKGAEQKDLRVIILSGGVSPVFSSGHDLKELVICFHSVFEYLNYPECSQ